MEDVRPLTVAIDELDRGRQDRLGHTGLARLAAIGGCLTGSNAAKVIEDAPESHAEEAVSDESAVVT
jgi:hypothetical protein